LSILAKTRKQGVRTNTLNACMLPSDHFVPNHSLHFNTLNMGTSNTTTN